MFFTIVKSTELTFRKYKNMKMAIWHITTHFVVEGHKYTLNIAMFQDTCEPICSKLGMILNTTKLYSLIPVSMTLKFTEGHLATENLELMQSL